jgi:V8-like Glu-specific endopeptidase
MKLRFLVASALLAAAAAASSSGCSSETAREATERSSAAIQRGTDDATHTFAVGVCGAGTGPADCPVTCSGALIAPNLVVTARHCVESTNAKVACASARFTTRMADAAHYWITTDASMHQPAAGWHRAAEIVTPAEPEVCGNDIALLVLEDVIPAAEATPAAPTGPCPRTPSAPR